MSDPAQALPEHLQRSIHGGVGTLTFNRPESLNPLSAAHLWQLEGAVRELSTNPDVSIIVLTGAGRAFSAGGDLRTLSRDVVLEAGEAMLAALTAVRRSPKPVLARVNGDAVGGGNEIVIACDLAVASESARLGQAGTKLGWAPIAGATNFLGMMVGDKRAREITFLSKIVTSEVAQDWGWVNEVVPDDELDDAVQRWCDELMARAPTGLRLAKATSNFWWDLSYSAMVSGLTIMAEGLTDEIVSEGVAAFFEKRTPEWPAR